ncbi:hypothetical protein YC2023_069549 [Brassica napus]
MRASGTFDITSGAVDVFPEVSLSFGGGASTVLTPIAEFCYVTGHLEVNVSATRGGGSKDVINIGQ